GGNEFRLFEIALPRFEVGVLFLADLQKRIARQRIHRLAAAIEHQRQAAEFGVRKIFFLRRAQRVQKPRRHHARYNEWQPFFHGQAFRWVEPPARESHSALFSPLTRHGAKTWVTKWVSTWVTVFISFLRLLRAMSWKTLTQVARRL